MSYEGCLLLQDLVQSCARVRRRSATVHLNHVGLNDVGDLGTH
jgi:hypothetical protein